MSGGKVHGIRDLQGGAEEGKDVLAERVAGGLEAGYQCCGLGERGWEGLETRVRWTNVESFFRVSVFCAFGVERFALHGDPAAVYAACFIRMDLEVLLLFYGRVEELARLIWFVSCGQCLWC